MEDLSKYTCEELKRGYANLKDRFKCVVCGQEFEKGIIYAHENINYEAEKFMSKHIEAAHHSMFEYLLGLGKDETGLSEHQAKIIRAFYDKLPDNTVQQQLGIGSISTVRNHRFNLKEKEKQAKIFLAVMELLHERENSPEEKIMEKFIEPHKTATMIDDRYKVTEEESQKLLKKYFPPELNGKLSTFYIKEKAKIVVLRYIAKAFETGRIYNEKEVNAIIKNYFDDYAVIRRYLIEYGFMARKSDCTEYWLKESPDTAS